MDYPYVTNNPFRRLRTASSKHWNDLRPEAKNADQKEKAGIPTSAALNTLFGNANKIQCTSILKAAVNDPLQRTIFRLFWPLNYQPPLEPTHGIGDIIALLQLAEVKVLFDRDAPSDVAQLQFLLVWFQFISDHSSDDLDSAFTYFQQLTREKDFTRRLEKILCSESVLEENCHQVVLDAHAAAATSILEQSCRVAMTWLREGNSEDAFDVLELVIDAGFVEDLIIQALEVTVLPAGDRMKHHVAAIADELERKVNLVVWTPNCNATEVEAARQLQRLSNLLEDKLPEAADWRRTAENLGDIVGYAARRHAIDLANEKHDYQQAITISLSLKSLPVSTALDSRLDEDLIVLRNNLAAQETPDRVALRTTTPTLPTPSVAPSALGTHVEQQNDRISVQITPSQPISSNKTAQETILLNSAAEELKAIVIGVSRRTLILEEAMSRLVALRKSLALTDFQHCNGPWKQRFITLRLSCNTADGRNQFLNDLVRLERNSRL